MKTLRQISVIFLTLVGAPLLGAFALVVIDAVTRSQELGTAGTLFALMALTVFLWVRWRDGDIRLPLVSLAGVEDYEARREAKVQERARRRAAVGRAPAPLPVDDDGFVIVPPADH